VATAPEDPDDEALRWAGDEERGLEPAFREQERAAPTASGDPASAAVVAAPAGRAGTLRRLAVVPFLLAYLAIAIGWGIGVQRIASGATDPIGAGLWQFGEFFAIIAAPLWFAAAIVGTRRAPLLARLGWLLLGVAVLLPWPFLLAVTA